MLVTLFGRTTALRLAKLKNKLSPTSVKPSPKAAYSKAVSPAKICVPIEATLLLTINVFKEVQLLNALLPMEIAGPSSI